ncbi:MAG: NrtA/SsuA/CpmA family ABC transporter substrate-binding protein [Desulfobacteraceae bacterium]|nr:NrtA/SsuA/CpmA family ABC transporter substrate-binding protein [Desulfobacteraceae bacterium]
MGCKPGESPKSLEKVRLGFSKSFLSIPVYIAKEQGYFFEQGLDVALTGYGSGKLATKGLFAGEVDISTVADMPVVFNSFKRQDFCIFSTFADSYSFIKIIGHKDSGIKTGLDLKGKKIGVNIGTSSHFFLGMFLIYNRLSISDVELVNIKVVDMPAALKNNEVDAVSVWLPYSQETHRLLQDNAIELPSSEIYRATFNFAAHKSFAKDHPEILKKLLRAIDRSAEFIKNNKEKSQELIAKNFNLNKEIVSAAWNDFDFNISLDQALLISWDEVARWTIENKFTNSKKIPNYLDFIYLDALDAVKPELITIIR